MNVLLLAYLSYHLQLCDISVDVLESERIDSWEALSIIQYQVKILGTHHSLYAY